MKKDMLQALFFLQRKFGKKFTPFDQLAKSKDPVLRQKYTLSFIDHAIEELIELRRELPLRKHWSKKKNNEPDMKRVLDEYVDVLHFYITIALVNGWSAKKVFNAYLLKNNVNHERQRTNY